MAESQTTTRLRKRKKKCSPPRASHDEDDVPNNVEQDLKRRRTHLEHLFTKGHITPLLKRGVSFPKSDPREFIDQIRAQRRREYDAELQKAARDERINSDWLYELGPEPTPLMRSLVELVNHPNRKREQNMLFRIETEIELGENLGIQNPWIINTNMRFELGITDINLNALACNMRVPGYSNACFRSLDIPILYTVNGVECTIIAKIYARGVVVMIGVRPADRGVECAQKVVDCLRSHGLDCSVRNLAVTNIVIAFDLGANLNLERMAKCYPEQLNRYQYLPMCSYFPPGRTSPIAFLFRTGCGLIPGVHTTEEGRRFLLQIFQDAKAFLYRGTTIVDPSSIEYAPSGLHQITGIDEMLRYLGSSDMRNHAGGDDAANNEIRSIMGALNGILDDEALDEIGSDTEEGGDAG